MSCFGVLCNILGYLLLQLLSALQLIYCLKQTKVNMGHMLLSTTVLWYKHLVSALDNETEIEPMPSVSHHDRLLEMWYTVPLISTQDSINALCIIQKALACKAYRELLSIVYIECIHSCYFTKHMLQLVSKGVQPSQTWQNKKSVTACR